MNFSLPDPIKWQQLSKRQHCHEMSQRPERETNERGGFSLTAFSTLSRKPGTPYVCNIYERSRVAIDPYPYLWSLISKAMPASSRYVCHALTCDHFCLHVPSKDWHRITKNSWENFIDWLNIV